MTTLMIVAACPPPGDRVLRRAVADAAALVFGPDAVDRVHGEREGIAIVRLAPVPSRRARVDDPAGPQAMEAAVAAALRTAAAGHCSVAVRGLGPAVSEAARLDALTQREIDRLGGDAADASAALAARWDIAEILERHAIRTLYQPIVDTTSGELIGYEALSRGPAGHPLESPLALLATAERAGLAREIEMEMVRCASMRAVERLRDRDLLLFINAPPTQQWAGRRAADAASDPAAFWPRSQTVLEVTERTPFENTPEVWAALERVRRTGVRFALDDAGAGYAGLAALSMLRPEIVKVDMGLIRDCDTDPVKQAVVAALALFVQSTGARLIAEGVETAGELACVRRLGVDYVQGYLVARPAEIPPAVHPAVVAPEPLPRVAS